MSLLAIGLWLFITTAAGSQTLAVVRTGEQGAAGENARLAKSRGNSVLPARREPLTLHTVAQVAPDVPTPLPVEWDGPMETADSSAYADRTTGSFTDVPR